MLVIKKMMKGGEDNENICKCIDEEEKNRFEIFECLFIVVSCDVSLSLLQN